MKNIDERQQIILFDSEKAGHQPINRYNHTYKVFCLTLKNFLLNNETQTEMKRCCSVKSAMNHVDVSPLW